MNTIVVVSNLLRFAENGKWTLKIALNWLCKWGGQSHCSKRWDKPIIGRQKSSNILLRIDKNVYLLSNDSLMLCLLYVPQRFFLEYSSAALLKEKNQIKIGSLVQF